MSAPAAALRAVFLAAGFGTRMYPLTRTVAKPLLEVGGEPLLTRLVRQVGELPAEVDGVVVTNARFHADFVRWRDGLAGAPPLALVDDGVHTNEERLGAVADLDLALRAAPPRVVDGYVVCAGDNLFDFALAPFAARLLEGGVAQLILRRVPAPVPAGRYGEVTVDEAGRVLAFREKPADPRTDVSAIAVYFLPPELPELVAGYLASGGPVDAPGHLLAWLAERIPLEGTFLAGAWFDLGDRASYERACEHFGGG